MSQPPSDTPAYQPYGSPPPAANTLVCPKCRAQMRTYERNGVHLEQCDGCRGVFLDYGELEHLTAMEARMVQPPPTPQYGADPGYGPAWGHKGGKGYRRGGFSGLFFSS